DLGVGRCRLTGEHAVGMPNSLRNATIRRGDDDVPVRRALSVTVQPGGRVSADMVSIGLPGQLGAEYEPRVAGGKWPSRRAGDELVRPSDADGVQPAAPDKVHNGAARRRGTELWAHAPHVAGRDQRLPLQF